MGDMSNEPIPRQISLAARLLNARIKTELAEYELGRGEYRVLFALCREEGISQNKLCEQFHLDKGVVTRVVDRLEEKGFVERRSDPADKRRNLLYLTTNAEEIRSEIAELKQAIDAEITAGLSAEEVESLSRGLLVVCQNLDASPVNDRSS